MEIFEFLFELFYNAAEVSGQVTSDKSKSKKSRIVAGIIFYLTFLFTVFSFVYFGIKTFADVPALGCICFAAAVLLITVAVCAFVKSAKKKK